MGIDESEKLRKRNKRETNECERKTKRTRKNKKLNKNFTFNFLLKKQRKGKRNK